MESFVAAYSLVWFAVLVYVARLGAEQRKIAKSIEALQASIKNDETTIDGSAKIAA